MPSLVIIDSTLESPFHHCQKLCSRRWYVFEDFHIISNFRLFLFLSICVLTIRLEKREILTRSPTFPPGSLCAVEMSFSMTSTTIDAATPMTLLMVTESLWYDTTTSMIWVFLNATDTNVVPSCIIFNSSRSGHWCNFAAFFMIVQVVLNMFHNLGCHFLDLFYGLLQCTRNSYLNFRSNLGKKLTNTSRNAAVETAFEHFVNPDKKPSSKVYEVGLESGLAASRSVCS